MSRDVTVKAREPGRRVPDFTPATVPMFSDSIVAWAEVVVQAMWDELQRQREKKLKGGKPS